ncbi:MAG: aminomethyl-transferring glycine dehydrogenase subunit GcvPA [SAR202 cluster bacterium]|nr:aminomethyl-transferring glycine dehydrogenase subunit GcvPA [SAR202 cluster bacterium]
MEKFISPYSPITNEDKAEMLKSIGINSQSELFSDLPQKFIDPSLNLPESISEFDLLTEISILADKNKTPGKIPSFLGAGSYRHFIPSVVKQISSRGEYMTAYTPYQPEISQGTLQVGYEFQSMICELTGMEVANSGMYDGATALAEAALMASRVTRRNEIIILDTVFPRYYNVVKTFLKSSNISLFQANSIDHIKSLSSEKTAAVLVQSPNFFGYTENLTEIQQITQAISALFVVSSDPISMAFFKPPAHYNADIVVAESQPLGIPPSFGGPYLGIFACKKKYLRQMPGRIVGKTIDQDNNPGFVLTLQAREQHIRRETATSNICTSAALIALTTTAYLACLGKQGLKYISELCYYKSHYAASSIQSIPGYTLPFKGTFFKEFVIQCPRHPKEINSILKQNNIIGGYDISDLITNGMLLCFTETNTKSEIDQLISTLKSIK